MAVAFRCLGRALSSTRFLAGDKVLSFRPKPAEVEKLSKWSSMGFAHWSSNPCPTRQGGPVGKSILALFSVGLRCCYFSFSLSLSLPCPFLALSLSLSLLSLSLSLSGACSLPCCTSFVEFRHDLSPPGADATVIPKKVHPVMFSRVLPVYSPTHIAHARSCKCHSCILLRDSQSADL